MPEAKDLQGKRIILFIISWKNSIGQFEISGHNYCPKVIRDKAVDLFLFNNNQNKNDNIIIKRKPVKIDKVLGRKKCQFCSNFMDNLPKDY